MNHTNRMRLWAAALLLLSGVSFSFAAEIEINAQYLEYDEDNQYIVARGSVAVTWEGKTLKAEEIEYWVKKELLRAGGNIRLEDHGNVVRGRDIVYDYQARKGEIDRASGFFDPWYFGSQKILQTGAKNYATERIALTTCDLPRPHYSIRARRAKVITGKSITVYHPVFYLGSVPVFYLPWLRQALGAPRYSIEVQPGYNDLDGFFAKVIFGYPLSTYAYGKLYYDYFSAGGYGVGAEYDYYQPDRLKGTIYGYRTSRESTGDENFRFRMAHWYRHGSLWTSRSDISYEDNANLNTGYFVESWNFYRSEMVSSLNLTRQDPDSNLQFNFLRRDRYDIFTGDYEPETITLPQISYTRYSLFRNSPYTGTLSMSVQNQYTRGNGYYSPSATVDANVKRSYSFARRRLTFNPTVGITENWTSGDTLKVFSSTSTFITQYYTVLNLRYYLSSNFTWDAGHSYRIRSGRNSLLPEDGAPDYGELTNLLYFQNYYTYGRLSVRNSLQYDFLAKPAGGVYDWRQRFRPIVNEVTWLPVGAVTVYLREESDIYPRHFLRSVQTLTSVGIPDETYGNLGVFYNSFSPEALGFTAGFGFWPTKKWKLDYRVNATTFNKFRDYRLNDQEVRLYRDLHCWETRITYRKRLDADEIYFQINLKASSENRKRLYSRPLEREFYPWRY